VSTGCPSVLQLGLGGEHGVTEVKKELFVILELGRIGFSRIEMMSLTSLEWH
jgi:hypothetical protein